MNYVMRLNFASTWIPNVISYALLCAKMLLTYTYHQNSWGLQPSKLHNITHRGMWVEEGVNRGTYVCFVLILWRNTRRFDNNTILLKFVEKIISKASACVLVSWLRGKMKEKVCVHKPCSTGHQTGFIVRIYWVENKARN